MEKDFYLKLEKALKKDSRFIDQDSDLLKSVVMDKAYKADKKLVEILLSQNEFKKKFFSKIKNVLVFNINDFVAYIQDKNFLADSYTKYRNKIGLNIGGKFLNERKEVALVWPFKDCVLEGGMSKEDEKRKEIFFNEILAQDEIDKLFAPKVLTNWKRHNKDGVQPLSLRGGSSRRGNPVFKRDENNNPVRLRQGYGEIKENLIIKGNNLLALHSLKQQFQNKIKLIYIDPPYNTGNDSFGYNDNFNHSTWLTFMKNRLEAARGLLKENGVIFISCDDNEQAHLKILMDEIFGRENFLSIITWRQLHTIKNSAKYFSKSTEFIITYARKLETIPFLRQKANKGRDYAHNDNDGKGRYKLDPLSARNKNKEYQFLFKKWNLKWTAPKGSYPRYSKETLQRMYDNNEIVYKEGWKDPKAKRYLANVKEGVPPSTFWDGKDVGFNSSATSETANILSRDAFLSPKPASLIKRIIEIGANKNSLILDFFAGSGTTAQAVLELNKEDGGNRKFILVEQLDYVKKITVERVKKSY